jgi:hypothetical protein
MIEQCSLKYLSHSHNKAHVLPDRVDPTRPKEKHPFSGGSIVSSLLTGIPRALGSILGTEAISNLRYIFFYRRIIDMFGGSKFLNDFILNQQKISAVDTHNANVKKDRQGRKKSRHGTKSGKNEVSNGDAFTMLCEEKPPKTKVLEYFRDRIAELVAEDMEK